MIGKKRKRRVMSDMLDLGSLFKPPAQVKKARKAIDGMTDDGLNCPYLGQIHKHMLDFDFHKQCSISLSTLNVYCCLVCGKYFQGKGQGTPAYLHSLQPSHTEFDASAAAQSDP